MMSTVNLTGVTVERCTNDEWLVVFGPYSADPTEEGSVICEEEREKMDAIERRLEAAGATVVNARGQRATCHGWNGARFTAADRGFGIVGAISDEQRASFLSLVWQDC
jgi:hypothetical protein